MSALAQRLLVPEKLDGLPPEDPGALASRRDLRRLNRLMGHARILRSGLRRLYRGRLEGSADRVTLVEWGSGDGTLMLSLAGGLAREFPSLKVKVILLDRLDTVAAATLQAIARAGWTAQPEQADVMEWLRGAGGQPPDIVLCNLFLHHFPDENLREMFAWCAEHSVEMIACEPRRGNLGLNAARLLPWIGCHSITCHDAVVSVRAGFKDSELSRLWPSEPRWFLKERTAGLFSHCFVAAHAAS